MNCLILRSLLSESLPRGAMLVAVVLTVVQLAHAGDQRILASPVKAENTPALRQQVAAIMALSEQRMLEAVPEQSGICFTDCPNCDMSTADMGHFAWKPSEPQRIVCKDCGALFPGNEKYPDDQVLEVRSINGMHRYPYYTRPDGYRIYFRAHADFLARAYMAKACANLAELYWLTKEEQYARRAAIILVRFAQVYPGYALHYDYPDDQKKIAPYDHGTLTPQEPPRTAKWSQWAYMDISQELTRAFDILRTWKPFHELAGGNAAQLVERDLLGGMLEYTMGIEEDYSNMSPMRWRDAIDAARVTGRTEIIHEVVQRLERFLDRQFLYDGTWMETSPSYMRQTGGWLELINTSLMDYEDPPEYKHPKTGRRLDAEAIANLRGVGQLALGKLSETLLPDGRFVPVNDTWSDDKWPARESMTPVLEPGFGIAVLGGGSDDKQYHAWLNFTSGFHHKQFDALSIGLWAHGKELLSDIGYTHTKYRYWATSTASHNTVLVDGTDQQLDPEHRFNRLRSFSSDSKGFCAVEAESDGVYPQTKRYRRTLMAVGSDSRSAYVVDVFQVHGGRQHDYLLAGSADEDSTAEIAGVSLTSVTGTLMNDGVKFVVPANETRQIDPQSGLGYIRDLRVGQADRVVLDYRLTASPQIGTRTWLFAGEGTAVYLGQAPSVRRSQGNDSQLDRFLMPMLIARRHGDDLKSTYVAVHEPVNGSPLLREVKMQIRDHAVMVDVSHGDVTDHIFIALDGPAVVQHEKIHFSGAQGMLRVRGGKPVEAHLVNGMHLSMDNFRLNGIASQVGIVLEAHRNEKQGGRGYFIVNEKLQVMDAANVLLLLRYPDGSAQGYHVVGIDRVPDATHIYVREKPAFEQNGREIKLTTWPQRAVEGDGVNYELIHSQHKYER